VLEGEISSTFEGETNVYKTGSSIEVIICPFLLPKHFVPNFKLDRFNFARFMVK